MILLSRREFIKAAFMLFASRHIRTRTQIQATEWSFPLAFPAYFPEHTQRDAKNKHKMHLPLITRNG